MNSWRRRSQRKPAARHVGRQSASYQRYNPAFAIAGKFTDAVDPTKQDGAVRTLAEMTPEQRAEMERLYGTGPGRKP